MTDIDHIPSALKPTVTTAPTAVQTLALLNLDDFEDVPTSVYVVRNPKTGKLTSATITLAGPEHPLRKQQSLERQRKMRAQVQQAGKILLGDPAEDEAEETLRLVDWTLGWTNMAAGGKELAYSFENVRAAYTDPKRQWLRAQVKAAVDERELFIATSAAS